MHALRHTGPSTTASVSVVLNLIPDPNTTKITFFASERQPSGRFNEKTDGPDTNLPLVAALAEYTIPGFGPIYLVFDGLFLTRARAQRITEVDQVLAAACSSGKAYYAPGPAPFTSSLAPDVAASGLRGLISVPLDGNSLPSYLQLF